MRDECPTCIFRRGNLMQLRPGRLRDLLDEARRTDGPIVCHSTLDLPEQAICRGHHDRDPCSLAQVAERLGHVVLFDLPDG